MYCPRCRAEYVEGIETCDDCEVTLVDELEGEAGGPGPEPTPAAGDLVTVFETGSAALVAVAKSILEDAGILYSVKGDGLQSLFGFGVMGTGFNPVVGPVQIQVPPNNERDATELLRDLAESEAQD